MSMFVPLNDSFVSFSEFLLSESIIPVKTVFGTDKGATNGSIGVVGGDLFWTVIKHKNHFFLVYYSKRSGYCGFGVTDSWEGDLEGEMEKIVSGAQNLGANALRVFGNVFFVLIKLVEKAKAAVVKFDAADSKLGKVYDRMVENKPFLKALEKEGWEFKGKRSEDYIFTVSR